MAGVKKDKLVFIFGPTGAGKSELACEAARDIGEIISVDSMQVYKGLDLGTAKPSSDMMESVRHHLISVVSPDYRFSAGDFKKRVLTIIPDVYKRRKIPFLVGGTGLYFRAIEHDLMDVPPADLKMREALYRDEERCKGALYERLEKLDPAAASFLHPNDTLRIVRALEVFYRSGTRFSEYIDNEKGKRRSKRFEILKIGLSQERGSLYEKLESRCRKMIESGLAREVSNLLGSGVTEKYPSMKGLGYSHFVQNIKGCVSHDETVKLFIRDTRRYAKRQLTWFRKEKDTRWFEPYDSDVVRRLVESFFELGTG
jgi:tRNA dimethylallyltransferase